MFARRPPAQRTETIANDEDYVRSNTLVTASLTVTSVRRFSDFNAASSAQVQEEIRAHQDQSDLSKSVIKAV